MEVLNRLGFELFLFPARLSCLRRRQLIVEGLRLRQRHLAASREDCLGEKALARLTRQEPQPAMQPRREPARVLDCRVDPNPVHRHAGRVRQSRLEAGPQASHQRSRHRALVRIPPLSPVRGCHAGSGRAPRTRCRTAGGRSRTRATRAESPSQRRNVPDHRGGVDEELRLGVRTSLRLDPDVVKASRANPPGPVVTPAS